MTNTPSPIWKDKIITLNRQVATASKRFELDLETGGAMVSIYAGKAYTRPGGTYPEVRVNDIYATYMKRGLSFLGMEDIAYIECSLLYLPVNPQSPTIEAFALRDDWSYDPDYSPASQGMNFPICDILIPGQRVPCSVYEAGNVEWAIWEVQPTGDFNLDFNSDFFVNGIEADTEFTAADDLQTVWFDLRDYPTATRLETYDTAEIGHNYRVGGGCKQYALYYVNAYGGWDTLAVLGTTKVRDTLKHYTTERVYDNTQTHNRGKVNYVNEVTRTFTFNTHPLNEDQASRMHHLLNSPHVYLHDVLTDHVYPIVLTGNTTEHSKGPGLHSYTIEAELAQTRIRR